MVVPDNDNIQRRKSAGPHGIGKNKTNLESL